MIRIAEKPDTKALIEFLVSNAGEEFRTAADRCVNCMFSHDYRRPVFLVAARDSRIIGAVAYTQEFFTISGCWGISWLNVHPDYRSRGLGQTLMEACMDRIARDSGKECTAILATMPGQSALYDRLGFEKCGQDHKGSWFMTKTIGAKTLK